MSEHTAIEWADSTFNPWIGCTRVSPACDDCYAARSTPARTLGVQWGPGQERRRTSAANWRQPLLWEREHEAFALMHGRRRRVFCASLADVFDNEVPPAWRAELFALIAQTPHLDWLLLTKRIANVAKMIVAPGMQKCGLPPNVWLGITVVDQAEADRDIPKLLAVPAAKRFLSIEPMLGPVDLTDVPVGGGHGHHEFDPIVTGNVLNRASPSSPHVHWVIAGGESGPRARPSHPDWFRSLRDQCAAAAVPFLLKQHGEWGEAGSRAAGPSALPGSLCHVQTPGKPDHYAAVSIDGQRSITIYRWGKKAAGRLLDGVEHNGFPA